MQFTAELDAVQKEFAALKEKAADFDSIELYDARQAIRPEKEQDVVHKLQERYADKFSHTTMVDCKREVSLILDEYTEGQQIQRMKREQQRRLRQEHRQIQAKKKGTLGSANKTSGSALTMHSHCYQLSISFLFKTFSN